MTYECSITLDSESAQLYSFLEYLQQSNLSQLISFAAITWPFPQLEERSTMLCQFALDPGEFQENNHKQRVNEALAEGNYNHFQGKPHWRPAALVNLPVGGRVSRFLNDREERGIDVHSMVSAYPIEEPEWRFAFGFSDSMSRDRAAQVLASVQEAERKRALGKVQSSRQKEKIENRYVLSLREGYDVVMGDRSPATIVRQADLLALLPGNTAGVQIHPGSFVWVYHVTIADWKKMRQMRIFMHISDRGDFTSRHERSEEISRSILKERGIEYTPCYVLRLMLRRDVETIPTLCRAISLLSEAGITTESLQTIVPPKMEFEGASTLYAVAPGAENLMRSHPYK